VNGEEDEPASTRRNGAENDRLRSVSESGVDLDAGDDRRGLDLRS
jgi:hypothetical protein